jgi:hypothetical protein
VDYSITHVETKMAENCRVTLTYIVEFESDDPENELAELEEHAEADPRSFIYTAESQGHYIGYDVYTERDI